MRKGRMGILAGVVGLGLLATAIVAGPVAAHDGSGRGTVLAGKMTGGVEVPPGDPDGSGRAVITLKPGSQTVCYQLSWSSIGVVTAAHIHVGPAGVAGPIVVPFFNGQTLPPTVSAVSGCVKNVDVSLIAQIRDNPSGFYVNVHTTDFPTGAIRDQLHKRGRGDKD